MTEPACLNCNRTEQHIPLLALIFKGDSKYICPQCLPVLIHKPASLAGKLSGAENFGPPAEHHH